jgi:hypothetical protein
MELPVALVRVAMVGTLEATLVTEVISEALADDPEVGVVGAMIVEIEVGKLSAVIEAKEMRGQRRFVMSVAVIEIDGSETTTSGAADRPRHPEEVARPVIAVAKPLEMLHQAKT